MMHMPKIEALDLRSLDVIVQEHNARGGLQLRVWKPEVFRQSVYDPVFQGLRALGYNI